MFATTLSKGVSRNELGKLYMCLNWTEEARDKGRNLFFFVTVTNVFAFPLTFRLGGGFKENDNVEYNDYDSDKELYDEVGRVLGCKANRLESNIYRAND